MRFPRHGGPATATTNGVQQRNGQSGSALVEFAVGMVLLLTIIFGIIDIGRALYAFNWVSDAARQATRYAIVRSVFCTELPGCPATGPIITNYVDSLALGIDTSQLKVVSRCEVGGHVESPPPCAPKGWVQVTVEYRFKFLSPFIPLTWPMTGVSQRIVQN